MSEQGFNLALSANFTLLGTNLSAAYAKVGQGHKILINPIHPEEQKGITISKMVSDINEMIKSFSGKPDAIAQNDVTSKFPESPSGGWESIKIFLSMVYLYYDSEGNILEYAFKLDVDSSELLPKGISLINISSLSIAVWNTDSKPILDRMQLYLPEKPSAT